MIHEVDAAIEALMRRESMQAEVEISFEAPTTDWASRRNGPTLNVFLYDIREDLTRRDVAPRPIRNDDGVIVARRPPPRRFKLSYLLTAWTQRPEDEHRLLAQILSSLIAHDHIPTPDLGGSLAELGLPVLMQLALPPTQDRSLSDIWSALGGELKPSVDLRVVAPLDAGRDFHTGPPALEAPRLDVQVAEGDAKRGKRNRATEQRPFAVPDPLHDGGEEVVAGTPTVPGRTLRLHPKPRK